MKKTLICLVVLCGLVVGIRAENYRLIEVKPLKGLEEISGNNMITITCSLCGYTTSWKENSIKLYDVPIFVSSEESFDIKYHWNPFFLIFNYPAGRKKLLCKKCVDKKLLQLFNSISKEGR